MYDLILPTNYPQLLSNFTKSIGRSALISVHNRVAYRLDPNLMGDGKWEKVQLRRQITGCSIPRVARLISIIFKTAITVPIAPVSIGISEGLRQNVPIVEQRFRCPLSLAKPSTPCSSAPKALQQKPDKQFFGMSSRHCHMGTLKPLSC